MNARGLGRPLRFRLFLLAASGLLPLAIVAGVVLAFLTGERTRDAEQAALAVSRAMASAVDTELRSTIGVLQSLALSDDLHPGRLGDFHAMAARLSNRLGWRAVVLTDAEGGVLLSSARRYGESPIQAVEQDSLQRAIVSRQAVVGPVAEGPQRQGPAFAVRVPVERDGRLVYVLSAVLPGERMREVLLRQRLSSSSVAAVYDQNYHRVARVPRHLADTPSPSLLALLSRGNAEGVGTTVTLEGVRSHTGYVRLPSSGWVVATATSLQETDRSFYGVLAAVALGLLASLALAAILAWHFSRDVTDPIDDLKEAAAALGRGEPVQLGRLDVAELQEVGAALRRASEERERATAERQAAEAERERLLVRATEALQQAEEAGRSKDEFLAMLAHELRNPLAPMATALHLMARKGDPGTRLEREVMERQVSHMKRLVDDLLDVSRITGKRLEMRMQPLRIADLVRHAGQAVQPVLGLRRLELDIAPDAETLWVSGDEVRLGQVLNNLLGNAIKFTGPEGRIRLCLRSVDGQAEIAVIDDGLGMSAHVLAHVFDLFYQAPQGTDRSRGGLGLGLAISRSLVEMHGGTVRAESAGEGQGSAFTVRLPAEAGPADAPDTSAPVPLEGGAARVLLVDDNQDAADTASALLQLSGYDVRTAYDPGVALSLLEEFRPDVAVLDIGLPGMSGYELAGRLRAHRHGRNCYLVALTGYGTSADVAQAQRAGFDAHLVKPARPEALLDAIRQGLDTA